MMDEPASLAISTPTDAGPVYFCCKGCIAKFQKDPTKYATKVAAQRKVLAERAKIQVTCPISKEPVDQKVFIESNGKPQVEWVIDGFVSSSPTFRVEAYEPLLGTPRDFSCTLDTVKSADGSKIAYSIKAVTGTFKTGHDYPLLRPGKDFVVRNRTTGDVVSEIAPLVTGQYMIAAGVKNLDASTEGVAITYFTVGDRG